MINIEDLKQHLREFAEARDWEKYHSPKNLVMAMSVEMAELMEHFDLMKYFEVPSAAEEPGSAKII